MRAPRRSKWGQVEQDHLALTKKNLIPIFKAQQYRKRNHGQEDQLDQFQICSMIKVCFET